MSAGCALIRSPPLCTAFRGMTTCSQTRARKASRPGGPKPGSSSRRLTGIDGGLLSRRRRRHPGLRDGGGRPGAGRHRHGAGGPHRHPHALRRAGGFPRGGGAYGPGRPGGGRGLPDPAAGQRRLPRPDQRAPACRGRPGTAARRPACRAGHQLGRRGPRLARNQPACSPRSRRPGWSRAAAWEAERRAAAADVVYPALARWVATVRELLPRARPAEPGRARRPARRRGRLRPGDPDLHHPAAVRRGTAPDRPGARRGAGGPGREARRRAWGCPGWTRCSPRCATRPGRSPRRRRSGGRWRPSGGPRSGRASSSPIPSRRRAT